MARQESRDRLAGIRRQRLVRPIPDESLVFVLEHEGLRLDAYRDVAGYWTIGIGHLVTRDRDAPRPPSISRSDAMELLRVDMLVAAKSVLRLVEAPLNDNQYTALLSFVFNLGGGSLQASTLRRRLNEADYAGAAGEFPKWNKAGGRVVAGLTRRRRAERALFAT
jgi:lysozyme